MAGIHFLTATSLVHVPQPDILDSAGTNPESQKLWTMPASHIRWGGGEQG
jgi:hypothetical protein